MSRMHLRGLGKLCSSAVYNQGQLTLIFKQTRTLRISENINFINDDVIKYVIGALQWKMLRGSLPFNLALLTRFEYTPTHHVQSKPSRGFALRQGQSFSFKTYKMYITVIFTHLVLELCKNKNLRHSFKTSLTLETRIGYICNTHGYQGEVCNGLEMKLA